MFVLTNLIENKKIITTRLDTISLIQLLILIAHLYLSVVWLSVNLKSDTIKTRVFKERLDYMGPFEAQWST